MRTENLAIVYVDIAGYTRRTSSQSREENERMLRRFDAVVRPAVRGFDGKVVKTIGDAYLLTFRSSTNALLCAMAVHDRLWESNTEVTEQERFEIRAAVNLGEVRIEGGDVFGEAVNIASRIESQTPTGEIYFSEAVSLAMTRAEVTGEEVGRTKLKGIEQETLLYRVPRKAEAGSDKMPYGGHALEHLDERGLSLDGVGKALGTVIDATRPRIGRAREWFRSTWRGFLGRFRSSRRFRRITLLVVAVVVVTIVIIVWPKPKPLSGWERFKRDIGI